MIQQMIITPWSIFTPCVYRMLNRKYVEKFFSNGELMLSSFSKFSMHKDEERMDSEGKNVIVGRANNATILAVTQHGDDAYILCSTTCQPPKEMMKTFGYDAAIQIFDTTAFGSALAKHVPGVKQGFEGYCFYKDTSVETKLNDFDIEHLKAHPGDSNLDLNKLGGLILNMAGLSVFFRKRTCFQHQLEYRWVWIAPQVNDCLKIYVPEAREFCLPYYLE
jgi:hypothetical protein